jgi:hypothetical protein
VIDFLILLLFDSTETLIIDTIRPRRLEEWSHRRDMEHRLDTERPIPCNNNSIRHINHHLPIICILWAINTLEWVSANSPVGVLSHHLSRMERNR